MGSVDGKAINGNASFIVINNLIYLLFIYDNGIREFELWLYRKREDVTLTELKNYLVYQQDYWSSPSNQWNDTTYVNVWVDFRISTMNRKKKFNYQVMLHLHK